MGNQEWVGGPAGGAAEAWLKVQGTPRARQSWSQWELETGAGFQGVAVVTGTVAKALGGILVTASERLALCSCCLRHIQAGEGSLEAWEEAGDPSLSLPGRCAGQVCRSRKGQREEEAFHLEEAEGDIASVGAWRLQRELHLEGGWWPGQR